MTAEPVLEGQHLKKHFPLTRGLALQRTVGWVRAVDDVSFAIRPGETLSLVGESGAGKTTVAKTVLLLEQLSGGSCPATYLPPESRTFLSRLTFTFSIGPDF